jgi:transcriptional regulator with PAS, ATPase and Fis domain
MTGANYANVLNMNSILITSGTESINDAINEAIKLVHSSKHVHKQKNLFQSLLTDEDREFLIYDPAGSLWFSSFSIDGMNVSLMNVVQTYLKAFLKVPNQSVARQIRDKVYTFTCRHLYIDEQKYTAIIIDQKPALFTEDDIGITIYNKPDSDNRYSSNFYGSSNKIGNTAHIIEEYSKSCLPVLITGEDGTGKDKVASLIYENGPYGTSPYYVIDCKFISERKWNYIINNENSPLADVHSTIYFKNVCTLSHSQLEKLFNYIDHTDLIKRNRLIFSLLVTSEISPEFTTLKNHLEKRLSCLTLNLLPLRERSEDIPSITALYLHKLNVSLGKQIIGLEAEAMDLFTAFDWTHNLDQLQHVLKELAVVTKTPYITYNDVKYFLDQETPALPSLPSVDLDLSQTLDEINYQIILNVLAEEQENKEKTASRLGISRSTLWRILKSHNTI